MGFDNLLMIFLFNIFPGSLFLSKLILSNMKKNLIFLFSLVMTGLSFQSFGYSPGPVDPVGTWSYKAQDAPEGYGAGDIVISREKEVLKASLKFGDYEVKGTDVKYEKDILSFKVFMEGEYINVKATFSPEGMKGTASFSEGDVYFTGTKKKIKETK